MPVAQPVVSDMVLTVKSRELQRGMLAEMRSDQEGVVRHFLAAAHLELVLADDYVQADQVDMALRSRLSAASCFWRAGWLAQARALFDGLLQDHPERGSEILQVLAELEGTGAYPAQR